MVFLNTSTIFITYTLHTAYVYCVSTILYKSIHCIVAQIILYTSLYIKGVYNINVLNVHCTAYTIDTALLYNIHVYNIHV